MNSYVIYALEWPTGCYVGLTSDLGARLSKHYSQFKTGSHHCCEAQKIFYEHGFPKVEVVAWTKSKHKGLKLERQHMRTRNAVNSDGKAHIDLKARQRAFFKKIK